MSQSTTSARDVALRAGVSLTTVSNTINRPGAVASATQRRVRQAISDLGFVPNGVARAVSTGVRSVVGLVLADLETVSVEICRGAQDALQRNGLVALVAHSFGDPDREDLHLRAFGESRVAGALVISAGAARRPSRTPTGTPTIVVAHSATDEIGADVRVSAGRAGGIAASHLLDLGCTRMAFVGGSIADPTVQRRFEDASRMAASASNARMDFVSADADSVEGGREAAAKMRERGTGFYDGIVTASDRLAMGILQGLHGMPGFNVPRDIAVVGIGGDALAGATTPPLSTVTHPGREMGRAAVELLLETIADRSVPRRSVELTSRLTVRGSSDAEWQRYGDEAQ